MEKLIINISASKDSFGAFAENCKGIYAAGDTVEECRKDVFTAIELIKKNLPEEQWPDIIKGDFEIEWHYDAQSLLLHFGTMISLSGLERMTGIHQKQLWAYMHGRSKPRLQQRQRLQAALQDFGRELTSTAVI